MRFDGRSEVSRWSLYGALVARMATGSRVEPFAKVGVRRWDDTIDSSARVESTRGEFSESDDDEGYGLLLGAGVDVGVTEVSALRLEYVYLPLGDAHGGDEHRVSVGAHYSF